MAMNMIVARDSRVLGLDEFFSVHDYFQSDIISFILVRGGSISLNRRTNTEQDLRIGR